MKLNLVLKDNQKEIIKLWLPKDKDFDLKIDLLGDNSEVEIFGAFKLSRSETVNFNLIINHFGKNTKSNTLVKAVLDDQAEGNFYGLVNIHQGATGTNTYLKEDALLLSRQAKAEAVPSLEIDENDVRAGHSSAVSPLNLDQLFYLQSRGLNYETSKKLLVEAFLAPVINNLNICIN